MKTIGVLGLHFGIGNKGCEALSYGFMEIINKVAKKNNEIFNVIVFPRVTDKGAVKFLLSSKVRSKRMPKYSYSNLKFCLSLANTGWAGFIMDANMKKCDMVFDFTAGDSFTDIYGIERFERNTLIKQRVIDLGIPLVLGNQTYGPFNDPSVKEKAKRVILGSYDVISRDEFSSKCVEELTKRTPYLSTDVAFFLPYNRMNVDSKKIKIGINPSGLLWCGGYDGKNQFGLVVNYQEYCKKVISKFLSAEKYEVYLIPHCAQPTTSSNCAIGYAADNDMIACNALHELFPETNIVDIFKTAIDAKSFISGMDIFMGARMHATIAAYSSGVPVIPFSYSRKFEGLYSTLQYPYVISAKEVTTEEAVEQTVAYVNKAEELRTAIDNYKSIQSACLNDLVCRIEKIIYKNL